ncbi:hypothetical protein PCH_Pc16g01120 [Penicillium rubens Wisconsin 54-1255]|uniref:Uncharacterized protein n=1 Tax=Penicillium rubens (strain ATCC 28089 / DSM 1075 / NRRL 1951 / Wisconsin 54-1255) TaxID=500485 RepID=B6H707_PENRW|nr:hypothetical protein PCH_Pc16g01120 [Penicillium rubens Wisconsin 54-1255]
MAAVSSGRLSQSGSYVVLNCSLWDHVTCSARNGFFNLTPSPDFWTNVTHHDIAYHCQSLLCPTSPEWRGHVPYPPTGFRQLACVIKTLGSEAGEDRVVSSSSSRYKGSEHKYLARAVITGLRFASTASPKNQEGFGQ